MCFPIKTGVKWVLSSRYTVGVLAVAKRASLCYFCSPSQWEKDALLKIHVFAKLCTGKVVVHAQNLSLCTYDEFGLRKLRRKVA